MATVSIVFCNVMGGGTPQYSPIPKQDESITSSASTQQGTKTAENGDTCTITAKGGAVRIAIGQNPTAGALSGYMVTDGQTRDFGPCKTGDKVAVIDAT